MFVSVCRPAKRAAGILLPAIVALGIIEDQRIMPMGSMMGLLILCQCLGMLAGPLIAWIINDLFSICTVFMSGDLILGASIFVRNHWTLKMYPV